MTFPLLIVLASYVSRLLETSETENKAPSKMYRHAEKEEQAEDAEMKALDTLKIFSSMEDFHNYIQKQMLARFTGGKGPK